MIAPGNSATLVRRFGPDDLAAFAALTGWPVGASVPDPLIGALLSCLLGTRLPGPGTGWLKQDLTHHAAAAVDEPLTARVTVTRVRPVQRLVDLDCAVTGRDGRAIASGRALMLLAPRSVEPSGQKAQPPRTGQQHPDG